MHTTMASSRYHWYKVVVVLVVLGPIYRRLLIWTCSWEGENSQGLGDYKKARGLRYIRTAVKPNPEGYFGQVTAAMLYTYKTLLALATLPQRVVEDLHKTTVRDADNDVWLTGTIIPTYETTAWRASATSRNPIRSTWRSWSQRFRQTRRRRGLGRRATSDQLMQTNQEIEAVVPTR